MKGSYPQVGVVLKEVHIFLNPSRAGDRIVVYGQKKVMASGGAEDGVPGFFNEAIPLDSDFDVHPAPVLVKYPQSVVPRRGLVGQEHFEVPIGLTCQTIERVSDRVPRGHVVVSGQAH
jgi:hypothetical protein